MRSEGYRLTVVGRAIPNSCLSVCLSVTTLAKASLGSTLRRRYVQHWCRLFSVFHLWIFKKTFGSKVMA